MVELLPLPFIVTANLAVGKPWANGATTMLGAFVVGLLAIFGLVDLSGAPLLSSDLSAQSRFALDAGMVVTAATAAGFLIRPIRKDVAALIPIDPDNPVHTIALLFVTILLGLQVTTIAFTDVLASNATQPSLTILDLLEDELPFLVAALAGVGIFIRCRAPDAASRLGLVRPAWWHIVLALACTGIFFGLGQASDVLGHMWTPGVASRVDATTQHVFGQLNTPAGIVAIGLIPGICEEILFRGALQPRIGLVVTALLFTSIHTEYGISVDTLTVFVIALGLGLLRKYTSTTASCTCHVAYNLLTGIGIAGLMLPVAVAAEAGLLAVSAYAIWTDRRRRAHTTA